MELSTLVGVHRQNEGSFGFRLPVGEEPNVPECALALLLSIGLCDFTPHLCRGTNER